MNIRTILCLNIPIGTEKTSWYGAENTGTAVCQDMSTGTDKSNLIKSSKHFSDQCDLERNLYLGKTR